MDKKEKTTEEVSAEQEKERTVRHTISAEETFTLAKDVFDLRCFLKNIYSNRAVIARRLNFFSLICSLVFTMIYTGYAVYSILTDKIISVGLEIAIYCMLGIYVVFVLLLVLVSVFAGDANTQTVKKYNKALKIFRICIRVVSIAMAIVALAIGSGEEQGALHVALETVLIIFSVIIIVVQAIPLVFGVRSAFRVVRTCTQGCDYSSFHKQNFAKVCRRYKQVYRRLSHPRARQKIYNVDRGKRYIFHCGVRAGRTEGNSRRYLQACV